MDMKLTKADWISSILCIVLLTPAPVTFALEEQIRPHWLATVGGISFLAWIGIAVFVLIWLGGLAVADFEKRFTERAKETLGALLVPAAISVTAAKLSLQIVIKDVVDEQDISLWACGFAVAGMVGLAWTVTMVIATLKNGAVAREDR